MKNVFFSYALGDELAARELRANLHNMEVAGWMDESDIAAGDAISKNIRESLQRASAVIVLVSERSLNSPWVQFELGAAEGMGKTIIPVLIGPEGIEGKLPEWLQGLSYVDGRAQPYQKVATEVERALSEE
ncbi:MAG: toll/interleukin-1 receptor domain-containing protein [Methylococcales bacterium]